MYPNKKHAARRLAAAAALLLLCCSLAVTVAEPAAEVAASEPAAVEPAGDEAPAPEAADTVEPVKSPAGDEEAGEGEDDDDGEEDEEGEAAEEATASAQDRVYFGYGRKDPAPLSMGGYSPATGGSKGDCAVQCQWEDYEPVCNANGRRIANSACEARCMGFFSNQFRTSWCGVPKQGGGWFGRKMLKAVA